VNQLLDNILERPKLQKIAILAVTIILIAALYYSFVYSPRSDEIAKLSDSVEIARNEKSAKQAKAANIPRLQRDLKEMEMQRQKNLAELPNQKQVAALLTQISAQAQQAGLSMVLFRPRAESFQEYYAEVPVEIAIKGSFHNTVSFFDAVGRLDRLVNIDNIGFKNPTISGDNVILETTSVATAFRLLSEAERKKVAEDKAKAAKGKK
jgi:type IV pilus assembly protein PilO